MSDPREIIAFDKLNDFQKKVFEMMELQLKEDLLVQEKRDTSYKQILENNGYFYALLDEFGELNHELKPKWCWWKQSIGEMDEAKAIEEFSDVTHFILSYQLARCNGDIVAAFDFVPEDSYKTGRAINDIDIDNPIESTILLILHLAYRWDSFGWENTIEYWICLYRYLGLDFDEDVYEPYIKKNAVNQDRMHNGY